MRQLRPRDRARAGGSKFGRPCIDRPLGAPTLLLLPWTSRSPALADWGIGYFIHKESKVLRLTQGGGLGTAYYCSIEQWSGAKPDPRMDVYALAMTLAELVQGRQIPNFTVGIGVQIDVVPDPATTGAMMFNGLLRQMTMFSSSKRLASMDHVIAGLQQAIAVG